MGEDYNAVDANSTVAPYDQAISQSAKFGQKLADLARDWSRPTITRRLAEAERERARLQTEADVERIIAIGEADAKVVELKIQAVSRLSAQWMRQQQNINGIIEEAQRQLPASTPVSPEAVDPDWISQFFSGCEDVSEPHARTLFAKMLAGEVAEPGTFSRRATTILKHLDRREAQLLEKAASLFWFIDPPTPGAFISRVVVEQLQDLLSMDDAVTLDDMGILHSDIWLTASPPTGSVIRYGSHRFAVVERPPKGIPAFTVTKAAQQLWRICEKQEHERYLTESLNRFQSSLVNLKLVPLQ